MTPDQLRDALSRQPIPWNEMRARRGLAAALSAWRRARARRRIKRAAAGAAMAALAAAALILTLRPPVSRRPAATAQAPAVAPSSGLGADPLAHPDGWSSLVLADGSRAFLDPEARLVVEGPRSPQDRLVVRQEQGRVRYEVRHDPARSFLVRAGAVTVRVMGTIFTVAMASDGGVSVVVDQGVVEVDDGQRRARVPAGGRIDVKPPKKQAERSPQPARAPRGHPTAAPAAGPPPVKPDAAPPSADALLSRADRARQGRDFAAAAAALHELVERYPRDARLAAVLFTLGTLERALGRAAAAADAFERCRAQFPAGSLAEDATAAAADAWSAAGDRARARKAAADYLSNFPRGSRRPAMQEMLP